MRDSSPASRSRLPDHSSFVKSALVAIAGAQTPQSEQRQTVSQH